MLQGEKRERDVKKKQKKTWPTIVTTENFSILCT